MWVAVQVEWGLLLPVAQSRLLGPLACRVIADAGSPPFKNDPLLIQEPWVPVH
jgi:hypothetical protein